MGAYGGRDRLVKGMVAGVLGVLISVSFLTGFFSTGETGGKVPSTDQDAVPSLGSLPSPGLVETTDVPNGENPTRTEGTLAPSPEPPGVVGGRTTIHTLFAALPVKEEDTRQPYRRDYFGKGWTDVDGHGCTTRQMILSRDLTAVEYKHGCKVKRGELDDPYTGQHIAFVAGPDTSDRVQIDHVVALRDAWGTGAQDLDPERRINFANDPLNLLAVDGPTNNKKGHRNAAQWLPPNAAFHCEYVARQVAVKAKYHLWVIGAEHDAIAQQLANCPAQMRVQGDRILMGE